MNEIDKWKLYFDIVVDSMMVDCFSSNMNECRVCFFFQLSFRLWWIAFLAAWINAKSASFFSCHFSMIHTSRDSLRQNLGEKHLGVFCHYLLWGDRYGGWWWWWWWCCRCRCRCRCCRRRRRRRRRRRPSSSMMSSSSLLLMMMSLLLL